MDTYLIADIGATHARFALKQGAALDPVFVLPTASFSDSGALVAAALARLNDPGVSEGCFAVAGPVHHGRVTVTNGGLPFSEAELTAAFGFPIRLVNDFYALARGVPFFKHLEQIGGAGEPPAGEVKVVLGPGSGLGMGALIPVGEGEWRVLASEGGHADLAPGNPLEQEVLSVLLARHGSVCWETVLSGPGLKNLYETVALMWGSEPAELTPEEISSAGVNADDPICHQTLELFFAFLGAAAGNLALTLCARGGVYVAGGIVPTLREFARQSPLRRRFDERAGLEEYVVDIPLYLVLDEYPGLLGAGLCLDADD